MLASVPAGLTEVTVADFTKGLVAWTRWVLAGSLLVCWLDFRSYSSQPGALCVALCNCISNVR